MIDPNVVGEKWKKYSQYGMWALVAIGCYLTAPMAMVALEGLLLWGAFAAVGLVAWTFIPVLADLVANWKMQAIIAIAEANPIATMQNLYADKQEELIKAEDAIRDFDTELGNFRDQVKSVREEFPDDVHTYVEIQVRMEEALKAMRQEQEYAAVELGEFKKKIRKAEVLFNMAKAANKMLEKSASAQEQVYAEIKEAVSFNKVRNDLNRAFANLNSAVERRKTASMVNGQRDQAALPPAVEVVDLGNVSQMRKPTTISNKR